MPDALCITVYGQPRPAGSKRHIGGGRVIDANPTAKEWKRTVAQAAGAAVNGHGLVKGPLALTVRFYIPRPAGHYGTGRGCP